MIVLVTGSRDQKRLDVAGHIVTWVSNAIAERPTERVIIVHGDASGADQGAHLAALTKEWGEFRLPAQWLVHGRVAGPRRNREMADLLRPDVVLAYPMPDSKGTLDMIAYAQGLGVPVHVFDSQRCSMDEYWHVSPHRGCILR